jgi:hypothetical protein
MFIYQIYYSGIIYIGSTNKTIKQRWNYHKSTFNQYLQGEGNCVSIFPYFEVFGMELFTIEELEEVKEESELKIREQYYMDTMNCINKIRAVSKCEHGVKIQICKECDGSSICEHGKQRHQCIDCSPNTFCEHGKKRQQCRDCSPDNFCEHGKRRNHCIECNNHYCEPCDRNFSSKHSLKRHTTKFH